MGRYLSPTTSIATDLSGRLTKDEGDILALQNALAQLNTEDQQLQTAIDALKSVTVPKYNMVAPIINNAIWTSGVYAGRTYNLPNNVITAPADGWVVNEVTSIFGSCAAANIYLKINNVLTPFNGGAASGNGPVIWDVRPVTAGMTITSSAYVYVFNTCNISYMAFTISNFTFFIPSGT